MVVWPRTPEKGLATPAVGGCLTAPHPRAGPQPVRLEAGMSRPAVQPRVGSSEGPLQLQSAPWAQPRLSLGVNCSLTSTPAPALLSSVLLLRDLAQPSSTLHSAQSASQEPTLTGFSRDSSQHLVLKPQKRHQRSKATSVWKGPQTSAFPRPGQDAHRPAHTLTPFCLAPSEIS